jgi:hypothetical protein
MSDFWGTIGTGPPVPWPDPEYNSKPSLHPWLDGNRRQMMDETTEREIARLREQLRIATDYLEWQAKCRPEAYPGEAATFAHDALIQMSVVE